MTAPMSCEEARLSLGVYVLGALDSEETAAVEAHLDTCPECAEELAELSGLPTMLGRVSVGDISLAATPPRVVLDRLLTATVKRHKRSRLLLSLAASIVVVAVGGAVLSATLNSSPEMTAAGAAPASSQGQEAAGTMADDSTQRKVVPDRPSAPAMASVAPEVLSLPAGEPVRYAGAAGKVKLSLGLFAEPGGTRVDIELSGIPVGTACRLVAVNRRGTVSPVSSWTVEASDYKAGKAHLPPGSSEYTIEQIDRFELITPSGRKIVAVPIRDGVPTPAS
ncbi:hypothetical protein Acor_66460 [Acrocarpospora corrugata]|uniref:Putative zinc-finger domain-containing protein n=1 Tax=Acrocarpospora corrugata TaxID=35763 RepID=A0A5M3WDT9_9ACTN|nr:zf-HC2 domain-containing protein [Acrocarpospora corrugata]GES04578.1 hypothetical protein Acor_66460 [Acrocarpospora corrugata]